METGGATAQAERHRKMIFLARQPAVSKRFMFQLLWEVWPTQRGSCTRRMQPQRTFTASHMATVTLPGRAKSSLDAPCALVILR